MLISFCHLLLTIAVIFAAYYDIRWRRIPNKLTYTTILAGVALHVLNGGLYGLKIALLGLVIGGGLFLLVYLIGGMGAGDVKMMGGVGSCLGSQAIIPAIIFTVFIGGIMAILTLIYNWLKRALSPTARSGTTLTESTKKNKSSLPYGVAIAGGTLVTLITIYLGRTA
jgi:prepilin peptidase CpaA